MSDDEWSLFEHFILAIRAPNGRKPTNHRLVLDGIFWIARLGSPWRDLPEEFGKSSSVYRQFRRWTLAGLWEDILEALNQSGAVSANKSNSSQLHASVIELAAMPIDVDYLQFFATLERFDDEGERLAAILTLARNQDAICWFG